MKKYKFILEFTKPNIWVYTIIVEANSSKDAYYMAFYEFARHIIHWNIAPGILTISYYEITEER